LDGLIVIYATLLRNIGFYFMLFFTSILWFRRSIGDLPLLGGLYAVSFLISIEDYEGVD